MHFEIPLKDLLENYREYMAGNVGHKQHPELQFTSPYLCHHIKNMAMPDKVPGQEPLYSTQFQKAHRLEISEWYVDDRITKQFKTQWIKLTNVSMSYLQGFNYSSMDNWFDDEPIFSNTGDESGANYRLRVLLVVFDKHPNFVFTFDL